MGQTYLTTGEQNAAFGANALTNVTTGSRNAAVGVSALNNLSTGEGNVAVGFSAGYTITTGNYNFALGRGVMTNGAAVTGDSNIGVGYNTLFNLTGGFYNIAFGQAAGTAITSGVSNICIGLRAGASITTESGNVCLGTEAGYLKVGASNVYLGNSAGYRSATVSNELIIDNQARADRATELTDSLIVGKFDATVGNQTLRINGQAFLSQGEKHKSIHNQAGTADVITASINDYYIGVDTSSAAKTVNLPAAATAGQGFVLVIKDESGNAATAGRNITIDANGSETIDGALTQVINTNYGSASLMCSGSAWFLI